MSGKCRLGIASTGRSAKRREWSAGATQEWGFQEATVEENAAALRISSIHRQRAEPEVAEMKQLSSLLLVALGLFCTASSPAASQFKKPVFYQVGSQPYGAAAADFNHDGKLDLAVPDVSPGDISILMGKGNGTFRPSQQFATTTDPDAVAVGDFNEDGDLDIAVTEYGFGGGALEIFLGQGDGTFTQGEVLFPGNLPYGLTVADFNGDGHLDIATANDGDNQVAVMFGNGHGKFRSPVVYDVPLPERVFAVDLNGDGHPDLAVLAYCGQSGHCGFGAVAVLLNKGHGTFAKARYFDVHGVGPEGIASADLNHDGKVDLVVTNNNFLSSSIVSVLLGKGDGTFKRAVTYPVGAGPAGPAIADFDGDGNLDIAVANIASSTVSLLYGKGNGRFRPARDIIIGSSAYPISATAADFNSDGAPDLAVPLQGLNSVAILINRR
jgi:hypothetical protein